MPEASIKDNHLAIVGEEDIVWGFKAIGFEAYAVKDAKEFKDAIDRIIKHRRSICLVQDDFYKESQDLIEYYKNLTLPIFIPFSKTGKIDLVNEIITDIRLRAIGVA